MRRKHGSIPRYSAAQRINHWLVALVFILLALSGLALFHPFFYPLAGLFGGGPWTRSAHPFLGVAMILFFTAMVAQFWRMCLMKADDWRWLRRGHRFMMGDHGDLPEAGKLNGGQKLLFWLLLVCMVVLAITGVIIWRPYFAGFFSIELIRLSVLAHAAIGYVIVVLIFGHIYLSIWTKESIGAMIYGRVRRAWAKYHHPGWFRSLNEEDK